MTTANSNLPSAEIYDICEGAGKLWVSHREGISSYDGTTFTNYARGKEFPVSTPFGGIAFDNSGTLWAATGKGAFKFDGSTWTKFDSTTTTMPYSYLFDVAVAPAGDMWFGSLKCGLVKYDGSSWSVMDMSKGAPSNDIRKISADQYGKLWIPTENGVFRFDGSSWCVYDTTNSELQSNRISSMSIAPDGSKWFGTNYSGIAQLIDEDSVGIVDRPVATVRSQLSIRTIGESILVSGITGTGSVVLSDLRGRIIWQETVNSVQGTVTISPRVASGVYVARVSSGGFVMNQKVRW